MEARRNRRKTLTNPSELVVLTKCLDLVKYTFTVSSNDKNIAKKYRLTMVRQIQDVVLSAYSCLIRANTIYPKNKTQLDRRIQFNTMANEDLHVLLALAEASTIVCTFKSPGYWSKLVWEVIRLNRAWTKSTLEQFKDLPE